MDILLDQPGLGDLVVLAGTRALSTAAAVAVAEDLGEIQTLPKHAIAVLGRKASAACVGYRLDVALREAASAGAVAVVLTGAKERPVVAETAIRIVDRGGPCLLFAPGDRPLADLVLAFSTALSGGADLALSQVAEALRLLRRETARADHDTARLVRAAERALGTPVDFWMTEDGSAGSTPPGGGRHAAVIVHGSTRGRVSVNAAPDGEPATIATDVVLALVAGALSDALAEAERTRLAPLRSRESLLSELLVSSGPGAPELLSSARSLGLPLDGWHVVVRIEIDPLGRSDEVRRHELLRAAGDVAVGAADQAAGPGFAWHVGSMEQALVLVATSARQPSIVARREVADATQVVVDGLDTAFARVRARAGVGSARRGLDGLRLSAAEARTALRAARAASADEAVAMFDAVGLQRMLLEWYGSETARSSARELLAPLDALPEGQAGDAVRTLGTYLDENRSLARTAERLSVHRNTVAYRMRQIARLLDADLADADQRLAVQLACRARLLL